MSHSKHKVSTDALETLGNIIDENAGRDAIHLAVEPVIAAQRLYPGQGIGKQEDGRYGNSTHMVGIVDPFLIHPVAEGERFWLIVYPRTITSLRHVWSHPDFTEGLPVPSKDVSSSESWLRNFCAENDCPSYETVMEVIVKGSSGQKDSYGDWYGGKLDDESIHFNGIDTHASIPPEFWDHVETVTGKKFTADQNIFPAPANTS